MTVRPRAVVVKGVSWQNRAMAVGLAPVPDFLYGTAWKEDRTQALTELALRMGFRGIDTANQRRHYVEAAVGQGLAAAYRAGAAPGRSRTRISVGPPGSAASPVFSSRPTEPARL